MKIIDYEKEYANATAKMWNESRENFGGGDTVETAEDREKEERNSGNIATMLAIKEDEVIGYCGLAEFHADRDALYIPLLNAHPQYIGKGIGKALVLEAIQRTTKAGWPRLDLHTWPGNTKAVPLYKRCGFFWEDREETTHLMNFIPLVLQHPFLKKYLNESNWYAALKRDLTVEPDREKKGEFTIFTYKFELDGELITVGIEHSSRRIFKIETNNFNLEWLLPHKQLFPTISYKASLKFENKRNQSMPIRINDEDDRLNLHVKVEDEVPAKEQRIYTFPFHVNEVEEEDEAISEWKTYPFTTLSVHIHDVSVPLSCGYVVKKPLHLSASDFTSHKREQLFLHVRNQLPTSQVVKLYGKEHPLLEWIDREGTIEVAPNQTKTVSFSCKQKQVGVEPIDFTISLQDKREQSTSFYEERVPFYIDGEGSVGSFQQDQMFVAVNGKQQLVFHQDSALTTFIQAGIEQPWSMLHPSFNDPLTNELANVGWQSIHSETKDRFQTIKVTYLLNQGKAECTIQYKWTHHHILEAEYVITNKSSQSIDLKQMIVPFYFKPNDVYLSTNHEIKQISQVQQYWIDDVPLEEKDIEWVFLKWEEGTLGLEADTSAQCLEIDDDLCFRWALNPLQAGETSASMKVTLFPNVDGNIDLFMKRKKATQTLEKHALVSFREHGFYCDNQALKLQINTGIQQADQGDIIVSDQQATSYSFDTQDGQTDLNHTVLANEEDGVTPLMIQYKGKSMQAISMLQAFRVGSEPVVSKVEKIEGLDVHVIHNGVLTFKVANDYYPAVYSVYREEEWFDHSFPQSGAKSWWNPWGGGIMTIPVGLQLRTIAEQKRKTTFVTRTDQWGQVWTGIKTSFTFNDHKQWQDATVHQYFLTLPHTGLLVHYTELEDGPNVVLDQSFLTRAFFNRKGSVFYPTETDDLAFVLSGGSQSFGGSKLAQAARLYKKEVDETLLVVRPDQQHDSEFYENKDVFSYMTREAIERLPGDGIVHSRPHSFIFTSGLSKGTGWEWLRSLQFKEE
ncbi:GNAT family N-acetyltransferase [Shouchella sp. 1P09AA]|uniref:GNAT family N-acetyltransferase n=1 Tax=unclassified Shouchella TaxID=2893065 RepID=UPI0039A16282